VSTQRHGRIDCATGLRLTTQAECEAHAATCAIYAAERADNLLHPPPYVGRGESARAETLWANAFRDRLRDEGTEREVRA